MNAPRRPGGPLSLPDRVPAAGVVAILLLFAIRTMSPTAAIWLIMATLIAVVGGAAWLASGRRRGL